MNQEPAAQGVPLWTPVSHMNVMRTLQFVQLLCTYNKYTRTVAASVYLYERVPDGLEWTSRLEAPRKPNVASYCVILQQL